MSTKTLVVALLLITVGCNTVRSGLYETQCRLHAYPLATLSLAADRSFRYELAYTHVAAKGSWRQSADTLVLESADFVQQDSVYRPQVKFDTSSSSTEKFIYKRRKLYPMITRSGCYLHRIRNPR